tara:strand:+ start:435 stop:1298 length:864 start_codon:yes stop_codon:yes gene_type:complete
MNLKKKLLTLCLLGPIILPSVYAKSTADASIKFSGRSGLPSTNLSAGYSFGIWGEVPEPDAKDKDPLGYGYVRAGVDYSWGFNSRTKLRLDVYPVAAAKISVGTTSENIVEGSTNEKYDATKINAPGKYSGLFWSVGSFVPISKSLGGYVSYESQKMENGSDSTKEMLNWSYNLYGDGGGDERQTMFGALFYKLSADYTLAAIFDSTKMKTSGSKSTTMAAGVSSGFKMFGWDFAYSAFAGMFSADNGTLDSTDKNWTDELSNGKRSDGFVVIYTITHHFKKGFTFP